jgi:hypothetical protein
MKIDQNQRVMSAMAMRRLWQVGTWASTSSANHRAFGQETGEMRLGRGAYSSQIAKLRKAPTSISRTHKSKSSTRILSNLGSIMMTTLFLHKEKSPIYWPTGISKKQPT